MKNNLLESEARVFRALMHPARLAILEMLRGGEQCVCHMEAGLGHRQAYISQHLAVLREAGLVRDRRDGLNVFYGVVRPEVFSLLDTARVMVGGETLITIPAPPIAACPCPKCVGDEKVAC